MSFAMDINVMKEIKSLRKMSLTINSFFVIFIIFLIGVKSETICIKLPQNEVEKVTVKKDEELRIVFTVDSEALGCSFTSPKGKPYNMLRGAAYEEGRIQQLELNETDCAMKITNSIKKLDDGNWRSNITYRELSGNYEIGIGKVRVIVAIPPDDVYLQKDNSRISVPEKIKIDGDDFKKLSIDCFATGAYPAVEFNWFLNESKLENNDFTVITTKDNKGEDGRMTYISNLEYQNFNSVHHNQYLKCVVIHNNENLTAKAQIEFPISPIDCELGPWNDCNATCGTGMKSRVIVKKPLYGGKECSTKLTSECNTEQCPEDCQWGTWSECNTSCGPGKQSRKMLVPAINGSKCPGNKTQDCNLNPCPIDCKLGPWSKCSKICGAGVQKRKITVQAKFGGKECNEKKTWECDIKQCPKDCEWGPWGKCSTNCGPGKHYRKIKEPAKFGGKDCPGNTTQDCNLKPCSRASPIDCEWGAWGPCSVRCGPGTQTRTIVTQSQFGGKECTGNEKQTCEIKPCPINCKLGPWTECSTTCGSGVKQRFIVQNARYGGSQCSTYRSIKCDSGSCAAPPKIYTLVNNGFGFIGVANPFAGLG